MLPVDVKIDYFPIKMKEDIVGGKGHLDTVYFSY